MSSDQDGSSVRHEFATVRTVFEGHVPTIDRLESEDEEEPVEEPVEELGVD